MDKKNDMNMQKNKGFFVRRTSLFHKVVLVLASTITLGSESYGSGYYNVNLPSHAKACANFGVVQGGNTGQNSSTTGNDAQNAARFPVQSYTLPGNETAGNLLVVGVVFTDNAEGLVASTVTVTDTAGNTYYPLAPIPGSINNPYASDNGSEQLWYAQNIVAGPNTITATMNLNLDSEAVGSIDLYVAEYSGVATSQALDIAVGQPAPNTSYLISVGTLIPNACDLVVALIQNMNNNGDAKLDGPGVGFTPVGTGTGNGDHGTMDGMMEDNSATGTAAGAPVNPGAYIDDAGVNTGAGDWSATAIAFRSNGSSFAQPSPTQIVLTSAAQTVPTTWTCSGAVNVQSQNSSSQPLAANTAITLNLSGAGLLFYSDSGCTNLITSTYIYSGSNTGTFYFQGGTTGSNVITIAATGFTSLSQTETISAINPKTWMGGASCTNWSTTTCWKGNQIPTSTSPAYFDANCASPCTATVNNNYTIASLNLMPGFTGTVSLGSHSLTMAGNGNYGTSWTQMWAGTLSAGTGILTSPNFFQYGGTFNGNTASSMSVMNKLALMGGTFNSTTGNLSVRMFYSGAGTFVPGTGTVTFTGANNTKNIILYGTTNPTFYKMVVSGLDYWGNVFLIPVTVNNTVTINNTAGPRLVVTDFTFGGATFTNNASFESTGTFTFTPGTNHTLSGASGNSYIFNNFKMDDSASATTDTLALNSSLNYKIMGTLYLAGYSPYLSGSNYLTFKSSSGTASLSETNYTTQVMGGNIKVVNINSNEATLRTGTGSYISGSSNWTP